MEQASHDNSSDAAPDKLLAQLVADYLNEASLEFEQARNVIYGTSWNKRTKQFLVALMAQQLNILMRLSRNTTSLNATVAPLFLRVNLEAFIKMAWIKTSPDANAIALMKSDLRSTEQLLVDMRKFAEENKIEMPEIQNAENWLETEQAEIDFRTGKLKELDSRSMATAAGDDALRLYRTYYILYSGCLHSTWHHISQYNLTRSKNPLHRGVFVPTIRAEHPSIIFMVLGAELFDYSVKLISANDDTAYTRFAARLRQPPE